MNDLHTVTYRNGEDMPRKTEATYLGGKYLLMVATKKKSDT